MAFWKDGSAAPKRNYRYLVRMNAGKDNAVQVAWWTKTVNTPSYEVSEVEHNFLDNKYYYPGRVSWSEITLTLVDPAEGEGGIDVVRDTLSILAASGYHVKNQGEQNPFVSKADATSAGLTALEISVLDSNGNTLEKWTLNNPFIKSAKYGDLDYSNDDLRTIEMTIRYDWATCEVAGETFNAKGQTAPTGPNV